MLEHFILSSYLLLFDNELKTNESRTNEFMTQYSLKIVYFYIQYPMVDKTKLCFFSFLFVWFLLINLHTAYMNG